LAKTKTKVQDCVVKGYDRRSTQLCMINNSAYCHLVDNRNRFIELNLFKTLFTTPRYPQMTSSSSMHTSCLLLFPQIQIAQDRGRDYQWSWLCECRLIFLDCSHFTSWWFTKICRELLSCILTKANDKTVHVQTGCLFWLWGGRRLWLMMSLGLWACLFELHVNSELCPALRSSSSFSKWNCGRMEIKEDSYISAWGQLSHEQSYTQKNTLTRETSSFSSICSMWRLCRISHI